MMLGPWDFCEGWAAYVAHPSQICDKLTLIGVTQLKALKVGRNGPTPLSPPSPRPFGPWGGGRKILAPMGNELRKSYLKLNHPPLIGVQEQMLHLLSGRHPRVRQGAGIFQGIFHQRREIRFEVVSWDPTCGDRLGLL